MRLLLVEDEEEISRPIAHALKEINFNVDIAGDGERAYILASTTGYDIILLDYNLPKLSGREVLARLRAEGSTIPIIILTVHSSVKDKVDLLKLGADDYLAKPFALSELLARIKAVLRRPRSWQNGPLRFGELELDPDRFTVTIAGEPVALASKEFGLLEYLMRNQGRLLSRQEIIEHVWDENADPFSNTIEVHIRNLRRKLENPSRKLIYTVSNRGYKLDNRR